MAKCSIREKSLFLYCGSNGVIGAIAKKGMISVEQMLFSHHENGILG